MPRSGQVTRFQFSSNVVVEGYCLEWTEDLKDKHCHYTTPIRTLKEHIFELKSGSLDIQLTDFAGIIFMRYNCKLILVLLEHSSIISVKLFILNKSKLGFFNLA